MYSLSPTSRMPAPGGSQNDSATTAPPRSASRAFISGSARPALISLFEVVDDLARRGLGAPTPRGRRDVAEEIECEPIISVALIASGELATGGADGRFFQGINE